MSTDEQDTVFIDVDVPREVAREAARMADEHDIAIEDALARLTMFYYPTDVVTKPLGTAGNPSGT